MQSAVTDKKPWHTHRWPWLLLMGPLIVILAGAYTSWLAFSRQDALVVDDYYKQGKAINQDLRRDRSAARLHLTFQGHYDAATDQLTGTIASPDKPYTEKIRIHLVHATQPAKDMILDVQPDHSGNFRAALPLLERTHWQVLVDNAHHEWRLNGSWAWPQQSSFTLQADSH